MRLAPSVNTLFYFVFQRLKPGCRSSGGGVLNHLFPSVNHLFASRFPAVGAGVVGVGRPVSTPPPTPCQRPFYSSVKLSLPFIESVTLARLSKLCHNRSGY